MRCVGGGFAFTSSSLFSAKVPGPLWFTSQSELRNTNLLTAAPPPPPKEEQRKAPLPKEKKKKKRKGKTVGQLAFLHLQSQDSLQTKFSSPETNFLSALLPISKYLESLIFSVFIVTRTTTPHVTMQPRYLNDQVMDTLPDIPMTFVRCETQKNLHVFIPEAFDLDLVTTVAENFR